MSQYCSSKRNNSWNNAIHISHEWQCQDWNQTSLVLITVVLGIAMLVILWGILLIVRYLDCLLYDNLYYFIVIICYSLCKASSNNIPFFIFAEKLYSCRWNPFCFSLVFQRQKIETQYEWVENILGGLTLAIMSQICRRRYKNTKKKRDSKKG